MSLRYKALVAVLVLVATITGSILLFVKSRVEARTEAEIQDDLAFDGQRMRDKLHAESERARAAIGTSVRALRLDQVRHLPGGIKSNLDTFVLEWIRQSRADCAVASLDAIFAEENRAQAIHKEKDWWIVACGRETKDQALEERLASSPTVNALIGRATAGVRTISEVILVGDDLCLAVAMPVFQDATTCGKFLEAEDNLSRKPGPASAAAMKEFQESWPVFGTAMTLTVLNNDWTVRNRLRRPEVSAQVDHSAEDRARHENPIHQILFAGNQATATSLPDPHASTVALAGARAAGTPEFRVTLDVGGHRETYIGLALNFDERPFSWDRPGFLALKAVGPELEPLGNLLAAMTQFGVVFAVLGALLAYGAAWLVIRRVRVLQAATDKVRSGDFQVTVPVDSKDEIGVLAGAFNNMIKGLQALGLYTDSVLARSVLDNPELLGGKASRHEGTILFTDIRNFTGITESMDAGALTAQLNEYFGAIGEHVKKEGGYLDKFIGDAVMAFWGPPFLSTPDHAARACRAALLCMRATADLRRSWQQQGKPLFFQRIGLATGEVVVGNIGSATKKNFTVIGDSVNLASRLEGASKVYGTEILLDERTAELAGSAVLVREVDEIVVRGKQKPVRVFELLGLTSETSTVARRLIEAYGRALAAYRAGDYAAARSSLEAALQAAPGDGPSQWLAGRCADAMAGKAAPAPLTITKSYGPAEK